MRTLVLLSLLAVVGQANTLTVSAAIYQAGVPVYTCSDSSYCSFLSTAVGGTLTVQAYETGGFMAIDSIYGPTLVKADFIFDGDVTFPGNLLFAYEANNSSFNSFTWSASAAAQRFTGDLNPVFHGSPPTNNTIAWVIQPNVPVHIHFEGHGSTDIESAGMHVTMDSTTVPGLSAVPEPATLTLLIIPALWAYCRLNRQYNRT